ncbi:VOC family protein [Virgibacillus pantothenticus]|uniref:VOC family protein n=1 Tax=Virgibacillus pantothenticus TaxID=1473 RepID=UPI000986F114|nr:VOC family protein [Virgibacillus pantothenticus]
MIFQRIDTVFIHVPDLEAAKSWYTDILELPVLFDDLKNNLTVLKLGETPLTLLRADTTYEKSRQPHFNFFSENIAVTHSQLQNKEVTVEAIETYDSMSSFVFYDLFGNKLEVCSF